MNDPKEIVLYTKLILKLSIRRKYDFIRIFQENFLGKRYYIEGGGTRKFLIR